MDLLHREMARVLERRYVKVRSDVVESSGSRVVEVYCRGP